jgi:hypothetical protein
MDVKVDRQYAVNKSIRVIHFTEMHHHNGSNEYDPCHLRKLGFGVNTRNIQVSGSIQRKWCILRA